MMHGTTNIKYANLGMHRPHWNDYNIKILKYMKPGKKKLQYCYIKTSNNRSRYGGS
jgi:hypothetical protein